MSAITIDLESPVPLAEQLVLVLREAIARGQVRSGETLPPVRQLAGDLGIHFNTVARAYRELEQDGLVRPVRGRGTVVLADRGPARVSKREAQRRLRSGLRDLLASAKLDGLERADLESCWTAEVASLWKE